MLPDFISDGGPPMYVLLAEAPLVLAGLAACFLLARKGFHVPGVAWALGPVFLMATGVVGMFIDIAETRAALALLSPIEAAVVLTAGLSVAMYKDILGSGLGGVLLGVAAVGVALSGPGRPAADGTPTPAGPRRLLAGFLAAAALIALGRAVTTIGMADAYEATTTAYPESKQAILADGIARALRGKIIGAAAAFLALTAGIAAAVPRWRELFRPRPVIGAIALVLLFGTQFAARGALVLRLQAPPPVSQNEFFGAEDRFIELTIQPMPDGTTRILSDDDDDSATTP